MTKEPISERMVRVEEKIDNLTEKVDNFIKSADEKYAPRWVADMAKWTLVTIGGGIAGFIGWLIIKVLETK